MIERGTQMEERLRKSLMALACCLLATSVASGSVVTGEPAPDFVLPALTDSNLRLSEYRSDVVVLNFWGRNCVRCEKVLPLLGALYQQHRQQGLQVLSIAIEGDADVAQEFSKRFGMDYPVLLDQNYAVSRLYDLGRLPVTVVIDREGNVVHVDEGFRRNGSEQISAAIAMLMQD